jgi:hypothetical protein
MDILQLIDRLEELFNDAKAVPFTHNVIVDEDKMLELIDQMRIAIPEEVKKAQQVVAQRDRVMAQAQEEANRTLQIARDKADQYVQKDMIVQEAQRRAVAHVRVDAGAIAVDTEKITVLEHEDDDGVDLVLVALRGTSADDEREERRNRRHEARARTKHFFYVVVDVSLRARYIFYC